MKKHLPHKLINACLIIALMAYIIIGVTGCSNKVCPAYKQDTSRKR